MLQNDRQITISAAGTRRAARWPAQQLYWSEMCEKLRVPARGKETLAEYLALPKGQQDDLKDVGGYVAGTLAGDRRKAAAVLSRDIVTLDLDNVKAGQTENLLRLFGSLGCAYATYSTRKHEEARPRLRLLVPLSRTVTADEYEPIARKLGEIVGLELCDPTTFEASRLMYWPSCCADSNYIYLVGDAPFLDADAMLALYTDWHNVAEWPTTPGQQQAQQRKVVQQGDPTTKSGVVGAFCKLYDIYRAMDELLPGVYDPCEDGGRYTYFGGSTVGGAVVYDSGRFLYSHHATDPTSGRLVNAFDLVRLHKFCEMDDDAQAGTPTIRLPSYKAMTEFAIADGGVAALLNQERVEKAAEAFKDAPVPVDEEAANWVGKLAISGANGAPAKTIKNVRVMLENDPLLKGKIRMDLFSGYMLAQGPLPWEGRRDEKSMFQWSSDEDGAGLRDYIEQALGFRSRDIIDDALLLVAKANGFNPVAAYLQRVEWDGVPRLDALYIDYLGAEDCTYTRIVTRKALCGAVARAMLPGCKFDNMTVICGRQGIGKSTLFRRLGREWFSDSIRTFEGKDAAELLQGVWIAEIGELEAFGKADIKTVKQFLSKCDDQYRAAYARSTEKHPRKCVFFGTTNDHDYLHDTTGNRRFWPVDAEAQPPTKSVFADMDEDVVGQIWAEAYLRWQMGEQLYLDPAMEAEAEKRRSVHMERDPLQGVIEEFLERYVPEDWLNWPLDRRLMFLGGGMQGPQKLFPRTRICAAEIWKECLMERRMMNKMESIRLNAVLESLEGWERSGVITFGQDYGKQRGFLRATTNIFKQQCGNNRATKSTVVDFPSGNKGNNKQQ